MPLIVTQARGRDLLRAAAPFLFSAAAAAQCGLRWQPTLTYPGTNGRVHAALAAPGGALHVCGAFDVAGDVRAARVARWDGATPAVEDLAVPSAAALVGFSTRTQVVALEFDAAGALVGTASTNALELTVGAL